MNSPLVSIIVPVYNTEKFVDKCLNSISNQIYKNLEIIIVNDGSTDNSLSICEKHKNIDSRILILNQKNQGLSAARNTALKIASGEFISFIDSDDFIEPDFISTNLNTIIKNNSSLSICCFYNLFDTSDKATPEYFFKKKEKIKIFNRRAALKYLANGRIQSYVCNKVFKKELFDNIEFQSGKYYEDVFLMHKIFYKTRNVSFINKPLYYYYQRQESITHQFTQSKINDFFEALFSRQQFFKDNKQNKLYAYNLFNIKSISTNLEVGLKQIDFSNIKNELSQFTKNAPLLSKIKLFDLNVKHFFKRSFNYIKRTFKL